jgi:predicted phosphodiesterase
MNGVSVEEQTAMKPIPAQEKRVYFNQKGFYMKKIIILYLVFSIIPSLALSQDEIISPKERNIFRVAIIGDRTGGQPEDLKYLERAIYEINQLNPDFVIHIGDMVQGYTRDQEKWRNEMEEFKSYMSKLSVKWYPVAGNHDVFSPIRDVNDRTFENLFKQHFAPLNYSFDYKNSHFAIIYTDEAMASKPIISKKQLDWLKSDLEKTNKTNIFIFMHKPIWDYGDSNWDNFHELIKQFPVRAVFGGHFHSYYKSKEKDGIQYYVVGPTGGEAHVFGNDLTGYFHHYSILSVEDDKFKLAVVKVGNIESDDYVIVEDYEKIWAITELSNEKTGISGWLWQPVSEAVEGDIEIYANNPTDREISVQVKLDDNMKLWSLEPSAINIKIPAKSNEKIKAILSSPKSDPADILPPQFRFEYDYINSRGDHVPVIVKRKISLRDKKEITPKDQSIKIDGIMDELSWLNATMLYNHTWVFSIYERPDEPPKIHIAMDKDNLYFFAEVNDDRYSYFEDNLKYSIIFSDAIFLSTLIDEKRQDLVIFPFNSEGKAFLAKDSKIKPNEFTEIQGIEYMSRKDKDNGYYYCEGKIPLRLLFGENLAIGKDTPFNIGVIDNDLEAFIYIRSWAYDRDPKYWGILDINR